MVGKGTTAVSTDLQEHLVVLEAPGGRPTNDGSDGPPLTGHELGQVQQLLLFLPAPLRLGEKGGGVK